MPNSADFDVLIVGAGLSGVGAAVHLSKACPGRTYAILEARTAIGGTWDLFRYPGVRSDSDMHTLGYSFQPWREAKAIADGPSILSYVRETARSFGVEKRILFGRRVVRANWSSEHAMWTVETREVESGANETRTCRFLYMCAGYYSYDHGHTPDIPGLETFAGPRPHPQAWPDDLDYAGKRVVVIGSGATAMTLVPAMARTAGHVVMLQRSPTYVVARPDADAAANALNAVLPAKWAYALTRWKNVLGQQFIYRRTRTDPDAVRDYLVGEVRKALGDGFDVERHFAPSYRPWDQRLCLVPNGDLFDAIRSGTASVVTDEIERVDSRGIQLRSGDRLDADIIVTATGLELVVLGGASFCVDGAPVDFAKAWTYKGMMYSGVPNLVSTFGYINASWTLRADLTAEWVCRLLNHLAKTGADAATPTLRPEDAGMTARPWIEDFSPGYMARAMHLFPMQGDHAPWTNPQDYAQDRRMIRKSPIDDGALRFSASRHEATRTAAE